MAQVLCPVIVGRDAELRVIDAVLDSVVGGQGRCLALTGEPGIGKSRLARELATRAGSQGMTVATGRAVPSSASIPYRPLTEGLLQVLRDRALPTDPDLAAWLPALRAILPGLPGDDLASGEVSAAVRGEAILQLLRRSVPGGLVLVMEDLHWADPDTVAVIEYLGDNIGDESILVVLTIHDEPASPSLDLVRRQRGRAGFVHLRLGALDDDEMAAMVRYCSPDAETEVIARVQRAAEGVPLLAEEMLASPGLPESLSETVRDRLKEFTPEERLVLEAASILGRQFDWDLLAPTTGQSVEEVAASLARGVECLLLATDGASFRFRHALTREAVMEGVLPPNQRALAASALAALDEAQPRLDPVRHELAADLAIRAGDRLRAGTLLTESGHESLQQGALATAISTLRRAADLLEGLDHQSDAELWLIEALALAGRVDEAAAVGGNLLSKLGVDPSRKSDRVGVHLRLAHAAVAASRWKMAQHQLDCARDLDNQPGPDLQGRLEVLQAEVAFAADDTDAARQLAETALSADRVPPDVRCHALEIVGRSRRLEDLEGARAAFEQALVTAESANLSIWRLRALHELGTIDLFNHAGTERLHAARHTAEQVGAVSTAAILDLQLAAAYTCHWELEQADACGKSAVALAELLGLDQVRAKAFAMLAGHASMRADLGETETYLSLSHSVGSGDPMLEGFGWGCRGMVTLLKGDAAGALEPFSRGMALLARLPHAEPAALRAVWPLLLASLGDRRAEAAIGEARRLGVSSLNLNRGLIGYAEAILAGRAGRKSPAEEKWATADLGFVNCEPWADLARMLAAESARADGWGRPEQWLVVSADGFAQLGLRTLSERCRDQQNKARPNPWAGYGVTAREADVLRLVVEGCPNKEIGARLGVSPRTVEKHIESLLRKIGARSRTQLAVVASEPTTGHQ